MTQVVGGVDFRDKFADNTTTLTCEFEEMQRVHECCPYFSSQPSRYLSCTRAKKGNLLFDLAGISLSRISDKVEFSYTTKFRCCLCWAQPNAKPRMSSLKSKMLGIFQVH